MNTKKIIKEAAFRLFEQRPFEQVTVQDILDEAEVSRRTFYDHFQDKYELMRDYFTDYAAKAVFDRNSPPDSLSEEQWRRDMEAYFEMMKTRTAYYKNARHQRSINVLWDFINRYSYEYYSNMRLQRTKSDKLTEAEDLTIRAFVAAYNCVLKAYLDGTTNLSVRELIDIIASTLPEDYRSY